MKKNKNIKKKIILVLIIVITFLVIFSGFLKNTKGLNFNDKNLNENTTSNVETTSVSYDSQKITNINTINITNENIKNSYKFVFLTDLHLSVPDDSEQDEQIKQTLIDRQELFVNENQNKISSQEIFPEIINYTNSINANAMLLGGDIIDTPSNSNFEFLRKNLSNLKVDYLYTFGNHDWTYSWNYQSQETQEKYYPKFLEFMDDVNVSYIEYDDLIILGINDGKLKIEKEAVKKIKKVLDKGKPTIVMMHIPIATEKIASEEKELRNRVSSLGNDETKLDENTQEVMDMIFNENSNVFYVISGHLHFATSDLLNNNIPEEVTAPAYGGNIDLIKIN